MRKYSIKNIKGAINIYIYFFFLSVICYILFLFLHLLIIIHFVLQALKQWLPPSYSINVTIIDTGKDEVPDDANVVIVSYDLAARLYKTLMERKFAAVVLVIVSSSTLIYVL